VQVFAASSVDLSEASAAGHFRLDLFHRLSEIVITIPPLAERPEDILALAGQFIAEASRDLGREAPELTEAAAAFLKDLRLSGNVRELRNLIRRGVLICDDVLDVPHLDRRESFSFRDLGVGERTERSGAPNVSDSVGPLKETLAAARRNVEGELIERALRASKGNKAEAARLLQIDYKTLYNKLKELGR
jgi:two-component system nitrogen regulation response regulator GlnG